MRIIGGPHELHTLNGRSVGILVADGSNRQSVDKLASDSGRAIIVAPKIGGTKMLDGSIGASPPRSLCWTRRHHFRVWFTFQSRGRQIFVAELNALAAVLEADAQLAGFPSVTCEMLLGESAAIQFVMDAFGHLKAAVEPDDGIVSIDKHFVQAAGRRYWDREPKICTLA